MAKKDLSEKLVEGSMYSIQPVLTSYPVFAVYRGRNGAELLFLSRDAGHIPPRIRINSLSAENLRKDKQGTYESTSNLESYLYLKNKGYKKADRILQKANL